MREAGGERQGELETLLDHLTLIAEASAALSTSLDYETTLQTVARVALPRLADWSFTDVVTTDRGLRRLGVTHASDPTLQRLLDDYQRDYPPHWESHSIPVRVMTEGSPLVVARVAPEALREMVASEEQWQRLRALRVGSVASLPMQARGATLGAMTFVRHPERQPFDDADLRTLTELVRRGAQALDSARLYEAAQQASRAKDDLLAALSHELRNPLHVILGYSRMLQLQPRDHERTVRLATIIERSAAAQMRIVEDLLDLQRAATSGLVLEQGTLDLVQAVGEAMESLRPDLEAKGIEWSASGDPLEIEGDNARIQQVLWNLLSNAIKFTEPGGCIGISCRRDGDDAVLRVEDSGIGIPASFLPQVFEPFRQFDMSTTRRHFGLGLGLSIVRHIVERHGGMVRAESPGEGLGATFVVTLPTRQRAG
jgi:signal transduction histidine kinase